MEHSPVPPAPPALAIDAHKGDAGRLLCVCGSRTMPGAALLVVRAAQRAGAGLVTLAVLHETLLQSLPAASPETLYLDVTDLRALTAGKLPMLIDEHRHTAIVVGPGLGANVAHRVLARLLVATPECPIVIDADALNAHAPLAEHATVGAPNSVWTPHPGEAQRLLGRPIGADFEARRAAVLELAQATRGVCVLKGADTLVCAGERLYTNSTGNPGLATAGSGDVLAGIIGAYLIAFGDRPDAAFEAASAAVYVHGLAADLAVQELGPRGLIASDLIEHLPQAQREHAAQQVEGAS